MKTYSVEAKEGILLNANESYKNITNKIKKDILEAISNISFNRYPEDQSKLLCEAYSKYCGVSEKQIMAGNGSDELLGMLIGLFISKGKKLYTMTPDFSMYDYYVSMHDGEMIKYKNGAEDIFDVDAFIAYGKEKNVDLILFSNPNNPTGKSLTKEEIIKIVEAFKDINVIVDEAYGEFNEVNMIPYVNTYKNLFVTRTLSKAFGMAGIRCGFLMGNVETMEKVKKYKVPYNVNSLTQCAGQIILSYKNEIKVNIETIKQERENLYKSIVDLERNDIKVFPSKANYLYGVTSDKDALKKAFLSQNIQIRWYEGNDFRITIGSSEDNKKVLEVIKTF